MRYLPMPTMQPRGIVPLSAGLRRTGLSSLNKMG